MPGGLVALLDDVSIIARAAAASVDDIGVAASRAGTKTAGVVIDDAAVTPSYVTGLSPARELPIIWNITKGSLKNKLIILLPGALLLSWLLPSAIIFILMLGGAYLSYEGAEKVMEKLGSEKHGLTVDDEIADPVAFEKQRVAGAIRTDLMLTTLSFVGTIAMLWVGGGIILHSLHELGLHGPSDWAHGVQHMVEGVTGGLSGILGWTTYAGLSALAGLGLGFVLAIVIHNVFKIGKTHGHG